MTYRERADPDLIGVWWRVAEGRLQWSTHMVYWRGMRPGWVERTPERIGLWTDLALNPTEP